MYIKPSMTIMEAQVSQMLAESLIISDETVNGSEALTKESADWDIWDDK